MWDKTNNRKACRTLLTILALTAGIGIFSGCNEMNFGSEPAPSAAEATDKPTDQPVGDSRKFQQPREVDPEDVEAFQNTVDQIGRLEYAQAEGELRVLLVRFESVDDPRYVSETLFWLGYCCEKQGVIDQARDYYQRVIEHYADTRPGQQAAQRLQLLPAE